MKKGLSFFVSLFMVFVGYGQASQDTIKGSVTYKTSQNIYVKFGSTKNIEIGDTLYLSRQGILQAGLVVHQVSSTSCVGLSLITHLRAHETPEHLVCRL